MRGREGLRGVVRGKEGLIGVGRIRDPFGAGGAYHVWVFDDGTCVLGVPTAGDVIMFSCRIVFLQRVI